MANPEESLCGAYLQPFSSILQQKHENGVRFISGMQGNLKKYIQVPFVYETLQENIVCTRLTELWIFYYFPY